jgi:hypothetical protein
MTVPERISEQLRIEHAACDDACPLARMRAEDIQEILTLAAPSPTARADRLDTCAQVIHQTRHRAGTAATCGDCRTVADTLARILLNPAARKDPHQP